VGSYGVGGGNDNEDDEGESNPDDSWFNEEEFNKLMEEMDLNKDGNIQFVEYVKMMNKILFLYIRRTTTFTNEIIHLL
jgi:hypothetical protein